MGRRPHQAQGPCEAEAQEAWATAGVGRKGENYRERAQGCGSGVLLGAGGWPGFGGQRRWGLGDTRGKGRLWVPAGAPPPSRTGTLSKWPAAAGLQPSGSDPPPAQSLGSEGGSQAAGAAPSPGSRGTGAPAPPRPPRLSPANTSAHLESWSPGPRHIWKYLLPSVGMGASQPRGRKGRAWGPGPPLRKWAADVGWCGNARRPQLVWPGPRALGSPG